MSKGEGRAKADSNEKRKKFQKPLDKHHKVWYNKDVPRERDAEMPNRLSARARKKIKRNGKTLGKTLDIRSRK